ncbi:MAG TPA: hypothetical protein VH853_00765 [Polyangia bacterium]|nr:hypothetical protein [Polyangia bacterium]
MRPATAGLPYSTAISVRPTCCEILPTGLSRGSSRFATARPWAAEAGAPARPAMTIAA